MNNEPVEVSASGIQVRMLLPQGDRDHIQSHILQSGGFYEQRMLAHMRTMISPGEVMIDAGAFIGNHTLFMAALGVRVYAYEPNMQSFETLQKNVALNCMESLVDCRSLGLGSRSGRAAIEVSDESNLGSSRLVHNASEENATVDVVRLDDQEFEGVPRLLKIDVEGMESAVLTGAEKLLRDARPIIYVESVTSSSLSRVLERVLRAGYVPIEQFNASPTLLFVPREHPQAAHAATAYTRQALSRDFGRLGDLIRGSHTDLLALRETLAVSQQPLEARYLSLRQDTKTQISSLHALVAKSYQESKASRIAALGTGNQQLKDLKSSMDERLCSIERCFRDVRNDVHEIPSTLDLFAGTAERLAASQARLLRRLGDVGQQMNTLETRLLQVEHRLTRIEAAGQKVLQQGARGESRIRGTRVELPRWRRKLRKLLRDPILFFRDMRMPWNR